MPPPKDETEEQKAIRLTKAKKNASKAREEAMKKKYRDKILEDEERLKGSAPPITQRVRDASREESEDEDEDDEAPKKPLKPVKPIKEEVKEEVAEEVAEEKPKAKPKAKKAKAKVIIEQDSSDDEVFEASKDVIFVKRVRAKPKAEVPPPQAPQAPPVTRQEQPLPSRYQQPQQQQQQPPKPVMTPEKRLEMERYLNMTRGNFLPMSRPR